MASTTRASYTPSLLFMFIKVPLILFAIAFVMYLNDINIRELPPQTGSVRQGGAKRHVIGEYKLSDSNSFDNEMYIVDFRVEIESIENKELPLLPTGGPDVIAICVVPASSEKHISSFVRLLACGGDSSLWDLPNSIKAKTDGMIALRGVVNAQKVYYVNTFSMARDISKLLIVVENHNFVMPVHFKYAVRVTLIGPMNPRFWWHRLDIGPQLYYSLQTLSTYGDWIIHHLQTEYSRLPPALRETMRELGTFSLPRVSSCSDLWLQRWLCKLKTVRSTRGLGQRVAWMCETAYTEYFIVYAFIAINVIIGLCVQPMTVATTTLYPYSLIRSLFAMFSHWDIFHFSLNMYSLLAVGPDLGTVLSCDFYTWALYYVTCGLVGNMFSLFCRACVADRSYAVGASGAIAGLNAALLVLKSRRHAAAPIDHLVSFVVMDIIRSAVSGGGIDVPCHVGGAVAGYILASSRH